MHIKIRNLLLRIQRHILVLLYADLFVDFEDRFVVKCQVNVLE